MFIHKYSWMNLFFLLSFYEAWNQIEYLKETFTVHGLNWSFPVSLFPIATPAGYELALQTVCWSFLLLALVPAVASLRRPGSLAATALWMTWLSLANPIKMTHSQHAYFFVSLALLISAFTDRHSRQKALEYSLAGCTFMYTAAGLWKLFSLLHETSPWRAAAMFLPQHIAYGQGETFSSHRQALLVFFQSHSSVSSLMWVGTVGAQILIPLAILFFRAPRPILLLALAAFHYASGWLIGPYFDSQRHLLTLFALICFWQYLRSKFGEPTQTASIQDWSFVLKGKKKRLNVRG
jgi:hypothetical protein